MPAYPPPSGTGLDSTRSLPTGWIQETDPTSGQPYYIDTLSLNPRPTWDDPRANPALYVAHDPSLGVTVHHHLPSVSTIDKGQPLPSLVQSQGQQAASPPPPPVKSYPEYPPRQPAGGGAVLTAAGALVAGGMIYRATAGKS